MNRTIDLYHLRRWMLLLLLAFGCITAVPQARAQMTGTFASDVAMLESSLSTTLAATAANDAAAARLGMEELYRLWRQFRQKNIGGEPQGPDFVPNMLKAEEKLFAASKLIDDRNLTGAQGELEAARALIRGLKAAPET